VNLHAKNLNILLKHAAYLTLLRRGNCKLYFPSFVIQSLTCRYRKVKERGLQHRENVRFYQKKPECVSRGSIFVSVGLVDCYPALIVLVGGILSSGIVLLLELLHNHFSASRLHFSN